jgi:uncharacterized protein (DUF433 family)
MEFRELIDARCDVMAGQPVLKGTRIPVCLVLQKLAAGESGDQILEAYPQLQAEHMAAALDFAARIAAGEVIEVSGALKRAARVAADKTGCVDKYRNDR